MGITIPPGFDKALALKLANASLLAYTQMNDPADFTMPAGYTLEAPFTADVLGNVEPFGYLMRSATDAVLAFRGTDDFPDAIADIRYNQATFPFAPSAGLTHVGFTGVYAVGTRRRAGGRQLAASGTYLIYYRPQSRRRRGDSGRARHRRQHCVQQSDRLHDRQPTGRQHRALPIISTAGSSRPRPRAGES